MLYQLTQHCAAICFCLDTSQKITPIEYPLTGHYRNQLWLGGLSPPSTEAVWKLKIGKSKW